MMKFKKILLFVFACLMCLPAALLVGCNNDKPINIERYFEKRISYTVANRSGTNYATLDDYTGSKASIIEQYMHIYFTGNSSWLYKMHLNYVEFDIYSNKDVDDFEMFISITNMVNGDDTLTTGSRTHKTDAISCNLKEGKYYHVKVAINDTFANASSTTMEFLLNDSTCFKVNGEDTGFKFAICNLKLYGKH